MSRLFIFTPSTEGDRAQQYADGERADAVPARVAGHVGHQHTDQGKHQADQRTAVFEQNHW